MKTKQKPNHRQGGFYMLLVIIIFTAVIFIAGVYAWQEIKIADRTNKFIETIQSYLVKDKEVDDNFDDMMPKVVYTDPRDDWQTYRDKQFGYEIKYPKGWYLYEPENNPNLKGFWPEKYAGESQGIWVDVQDNSANLSAQQLWQRDNDKLANVEEIKNNTLITKINVHGIPGIEVKTTSDYTGKPFKYFYLIYKTKLYVLKTNEPDNKIFDQVMRTFVLVYFVNSDI